MNSLYAEQDRYRLCISPFMRMVRRSYDNGKSWKSLRDTADRYIGKISSKYTEVIIPIWQKTFSEIVLIAPHRLLVNETSLMILAAWEYAAQSGLLSRSPESVIGPLGMASISGNSELTASQKFGHNSSVFGIRVAERIDEQGNTEAAYQSSKDVPEDW